MYLITLWLNLGLWNFAQGVLFGILPDFASAFLLEFFGVIVLHTRHFGMDLFEPVKNQNDYGARSNKNVSDINRGVIITDS